MIYRESNLKLAAKTIATAQMFSPEYAGLAWLLQHLLIRLKTLRYDDETTICVNALKKASGRSRFGRG
jgi:hypothetical protein